MEAEHLAELSHISRFCSLCGASERGAWRCRLANTMCVYRRAQCPSEQRDLNTSKHINGLPKLTFRGCPCPVASPRSFCWCVVKCGAFSKEAVNALDARNTRYSPLRCFLCSMSWLVLLKTNHAF